MKNTKEYNKQYYENNKEKAKEYNRKNSEKIKEYYKKYNEEHIRKRNVEKQKEYYKKYIDKNFDKIKEYKEKYYLKNKKPKINKEKTLKQRNENEKKETIYQREYHRKRRAEDIEFRIKNNLGARIRCAIKNKQKRTMDFIGCSIEDLMKHLEKQFQEGMTWNNYGKWHIDHIRPCASFNLLNEDEQIQCFHYTNLQPLWAEDNLKKHDKWINT